MIEIGGMGFRGVGFVKILASPDLPIEKALAMAEQVITMMRAELHEREIEVKTPEAALAGKEEG